MSEKPTFRFIGMAAIELCYKLRRLVYITEGESDDYFSQLRDLRDQCSSEEEYIQRLQSLNAPVITPEYITLMQQVQQGAVTIADMYDEFLEENKDHG